MGRFISIALALLALWGLCLTQLLVLWRRKLYREFWVTVGLLSLGSMGLISTTGEVRFPSLTAWLTHWFWIE